MEKVTKESNRPIHIHMRNTNHISTGKQFLGNHINAFKSSKIKHKDNVKFRLQIDEQCIQDIVTLVDIWKCNPFDPENQNLRTLQTGAHASEGLVNDFASAYEDGDALVEDSINTRLISKSKSLFDPYPKDNRKTFTNLKFPHLDKKHSQEEMETSALVATTDLLIKLIRSCYHENDVINVKDGERRKRSADFVGGQTKNVFLQKKYIFQV